MASVVFDTDKVCAENIVCLIDKLNDFFFVLFNFDIIKSERFEQERTINQQNIEIQRLRKKVEQLDAEVIMEMSERSK